jgi:hypothetical protein
MYAKPGLAISRLGAIAFVQPINALRLEKVVKKNPISGLCTRDREIDSVMVDAIYLATRRLRCSLALGPPAPPTLPAPLAFCLFSPVLQMPLERILARVHRGARVALDLALATCLRSEALEGLAAAERGAQGASALAAPIDGARLAAAAAGAGSRG